MSTLAYTESGLAPAADAADKPERKGFWQRAFDAMIAGQQRRADREIAAFLKNHGGPMTDDLEREIMRRLGASGSGRKF